MPLLFSLGQHAALDAVKTRMVEGEVLLAFLDDVITKPDKLVMCIWRFKRNSTDMPVSGSMPAKRRCGTRLVNDLRLVIFWSGLLRRKIRGHESGWGRTSPLQSRECAFWEPLWGMWTMFRHS